MRGLGALGSLCVSGLRLAEPRPSGLYPVGPMSPRYKVWPRMDKNPKGAPPQNLLVRPQRPLAPHYGVAVRSGSYPVKVKAEKIGSKFPSGVLLWTCRWASGNEIPGSHVHVSQTVLG